MTKERFDIHQHITDKIVSAIERGAGDFRLPWHRSAGSIMRPRFSRETVNCVAVAFAPETRTLPSSPWTTVTNPDVERTTTIGAVGVCTDWSARA